MNTRLLFSNLGRLAVAATVLLLSSACGSELLRTGRAPAYLIINAIELTNGATEDAGANLNSDVQTLVDVTINGVSTKQPTVFDDLGVATIRAELKNETLASTAMNSITITKYHVTYRRSDGRNTPGVDVPFAFDGGVSVTVPAGGTTTVPFTAVRRQAKLEPPLKNMIGGGGLIIVSTIADVTFYGRDQNGNEVTVTGSFDVTFADFGDS